jgi:hypothetical protein
MRFHKKAFGILNALPAVALTFGIAIVILSISGSITTDVQEQQCVGGTYDDGNCWKCVMNTSCAGCTYNPTNNTCYNGSSVVRSGYAYADNTFAFNVSEQGTQGQMKLSNWLPTIGLILGAVVVISILGYMGYKKGTG